MHTLHTNPYELPRTSRFALALISSLLTGIATMMLLQWTSVRAELTHPEQIPTRISDTDQDGLPDLEELAYHTSIYTADTDNDGMSDGEEVRLGRNPNGEGALSQLTSSHPIGPDQDNDNLSDAEEIAIGTDPAHADSDSDGFPDGLEVENGFDPTGEGRANVEISISAINVKAPLVWSKDTDEQTITEDLTRGVIHYPGTAVPGEIGNAFITGHSSDYLWQRGAYRDIFKNLPELKEGDEVVFTYSYANGITRTVKYRLTDSQIASSRDRALLAPTPTPTLTLATCYPVGTDSQRLIWRGVLE